MEKHLYDVFAKTWCGSGNIWFYSDPHFGDPEMKHIRKNYITDDEQVKRINSKLSRKGGDTLIILGDIGDIEYVKKLRGYKVLIMGNHDKGASNYKRIVTWDPDTCPHCGNPVLHDAATDRNMGSEWAWCPTCSYTVKPVTHRHDNGLFSEVYEGALMISPKIILSHEPIPNLPEWLFNIHGHDHSNWFTGSRHLNVCAEHIDYTPIALTQIIKDGLLLDVEDIHRMTIDGAIERKAKKGK